MRVPQVNQCAFPQIAACLRPWMLLHISSLSPACHSHGFPTSQPLWSAFQESFGRFSEELFRHQLSQFSLGLTCCCSRCPSLGKDVGCGLFALHASARVAQRGEGCTSKVAWRSDISSSGVGWFPTLWGLLMWTLTSPHTHTPAAPPYTHEATKPPPCQKLCHVTSTTFYW